MNKGRLGVGAAMTMVGDKSKTPQSLVSRMPSADVVAKVGVGGTIEAAGRKVVRRNAA